MCVCWNEKESLSECVGWTEEKKKTYFSFREIIDARFLARVVCSPGDVVVVRFVLYLNVYAR